MVIKGRRFILLTLIAILLTPIVILLTLIVILLTLIVILIKLVNKINDKRVLEDCLKEFLIN